MILWSFWGGVVLPLAEVDKLLLVGKKELQTDNQLLLWETEMLKVNNSNNLQKAQVILE